MLCVAEGFGSAGTGRGERSSQVSACETSWQIEPSHVLMQKSRVEAVAGAYCVHGDNFSRRTCEALRSALRQRSLTAQFHHD